MSKISYNEYLALARNPDTPDDVLESYSLVVPGKGAFDFKITPDPKKVEMTLEDLEYEGLMEIGNNLERYRRQAKFRKRKEKRENLPILVSEGDSWFQFPLLIREVIDHLKNDYLIWSVDAAGDTAENMVFKAQKKYQTEYLQALKEQKNEVKGFLFSAAGNDIIGENPVSKKPVLYEILNDFNGDNTDVVGQINLNRFNKKLSFLRRAYNTVIKNIRSEKGFEKLPVFIHGYDYVFPYPWHDDPRSPTYTKKNTWLGKPLDDRNIKNKELRRDIIKYMIDKLYDMLEDISGDSQKTGVWLINCRGAMPKISDWNDEIHGTSEGFEKVAGRFKAVLQKVIT